MIKGAADKTQGLEVIIIRMGGYEPQFVMTFNLEYVLKSVGGCVHAPHSTNVLGNS